MIAAWLGHSADFCDGIWPKFRNHASWSTARSNGDSEGNAGSTQDSPTFVFVKGDDIIGHVGTIPVQLSSFAKALDAHWIVGFMVLAGPLLIKEANRTLDCALSLFVLDLSPTGDAGIDRMPKVIIRDGLYLAVAQIPAVVPACAQISCHL